MKEYEFSYLSDQTTNRLGGRITWYLNQRTGFGVGMDYTVSDSSLREGTTLSLDGHHYFHNNMFAGVLIDDFKAGKSDGRDTTSYLVSFGYLF